MISVAIAHTLRLLFILFLPTLVSAQQITPALIYAMGSKFDKSFNEGAYNGALRFRDETGIAFLEFEISAPAQRKQALRRLAGRGADPIIAIGFAHAAALDEVAAEFPQTRFSIIDMVVDQPNVRSVVFREHEGSFVVGALAAMASQSGVVGFIGGMDIPLVRRFACGYAQGAQHINPAIRVIQNMAGTTQAAFNDPATGTELAVSQMERGVDVIFAAAGTTSFGVNQAAVEAGKLVIAVDSNQNYLHPGTMLTSMLKRVDNAVYETFQEALADTWQPGVITLGIAEGGLGWALDEYNRELISAEMENTANALSAQIASGALQVHDYTSDASCPR